MVVAYLEALELRELCHFNHDSYQYLPKLTVAASFNLLSKEKGRHVFPSDMSLHSDGFRDQK
jgi:hypothetical protein